MLPSSVRPVTRVLFLGLSLLLAAGCGGDKKSTSSDPGDGVVVIGLAASDGNGTAAATVLVVDGTQTISTATVTLNGTTLSPITQFGATVYSGIFQAATGAALTLQVTSPAGDRTMSAEMPGPVTLTSPTDQEGFNDGAAIPVVWTSAAGAEEYFVSYDDGSGNTHDQTTTGTTYTIPASATSVGGAEIYVYAINGEGTIPLSIDPTSVGNLTSGFWAATTAVVEVSITQ